MTGHNCAFSATCDQLQSWSCLFGSKNQTLVWMGLLCQCLYPPWTSAQCWAHLMPFHSPPLSLHTCGPCNNTKHIQHHSTLFTHWPYGPTQGWVHPALFQMWPAWCGASIPLLTHIHTWWTLAHYPECEPHPALALCMLSPWALAWATKAWAHGLACIFYRPKPPLANLGTSLGLIVYIL